MKCLIRIFRASLFVAPLLLSSACNKDSAAGSRETTASSRPVVDTAKMATDNTKDAAVKAKDVTERTELAPNNAKDAAVKTKTDADKKDATEDAKLATTHTKDTAVKAADVTESMKLAIDGTRHAAVNTKDVATVTPMHQGNSAADMATTRRVRKAIMADHSLSSEARKAKVITANGVVMLSGPVQNDAERDNLEAKAFKLKGKNRVENNLDVVAAN